MTLLQIAAITIALVFIPNFRAFGMWVMYLILALASSTFVWLVASFLIIKFLNG